MMGLALALAGLVASASDTLLLKDNASIVGRILAEKRDSIAIDIGYTVLVVPRNQIEKITLDPKPVRSATRTSQANPRRSEPAPAPAPADPGFRPERSVQELVKELGEAVVQVRTPGGLGSGFFITEDGYLITNFHVIEGETQISIEVYHLKAGQLERRTYKQIQILAMNKFADLALLKIQDPDAPKFTHVAVGDTDTLSVGDRVFAIGSPLGLERTVTEGILSTKTREFQGSLYLQTTAQINPGNSGGPLFNLRGEVVGVTNMKIAMGEGIGFAIPGDTVTYFLNHRDAFAYDKENPNNPYRYLPPPSRLRKGDLAL
jgi:serine protease Do